MGRIIVGTHLVAFVCSSCDGSRREGCWGRERREPGCVLRVTGRKADEGNEIEKGIVGKGNADCAMGVILK